MDWEDLIGELEAAAEAEDRWELEGEVADRTRRELARVRLVDRLRAAEGASIWAGVHGAGPVAGRVLRVGPDWMLIDTAAAAPALGSPAGTPAAELLVVTAAILWVGGLSPRATDPAAVPIVDQRSGLGSVLRAVARDRRVVRATLRDGGDVSGVVRRVGADFVELGGEPRSGRRRADEQSSDERCLPYDALAVLRLS